MKKIIAFAFLFLFSASQLCAQVLDDKYRDLFDLYIGEMYEKCLKKAISYTESDPEKKDATPYIYTSMCYLYIHKNYNKFKADKYPDPLKQALTYADKFRKKDKDGSKYTKNKEYMLELKKSAVDEMTLQAGKQDFKRASATGKLLMKVYFQDPDASLITGIYLLLAKNTSEGNTAIETSLTAIKKNLSAPTDSAKNAEPMDKVTAALYSDAFMLYTEYLISGNETVKAKNAIVLAKDLLRKDDKIQQQFDRLK